MTDNNYFKIFSIEESFVIDSAGLEKQYFDLQRQFHPDKFVNASGAERVQAALKSTEINEGYRILKDSLTRAEYILKVNDQEMPKPEQELLMEVLEKREALSSVNNVDETLSLEESAMSVEAECTVDIEKAFADNDLDKAACLVNRLRFLKKYTEEVRTRRLRLDAAA